MPYPPLDEWNVYETDQRLFLREIIRLQREQNDLLRALKDAQSPREETQLRLAPAYTMRRMTVTEAVARFIPAQWRR